MNNYRMTTGLANEEVISCTVVANKKRQQSKKAMGCMKAKYKCAIWYGKDEKVSQKRRGTSGE